MDQNRSENNTNQQQNVHLHMHHVCNCQGNVYPTYYPAVGYRTPVPSLVTYPPPPVPRPYFQHYQYTQFNMGNQYSVPMTHVAASSPVYGSGSTAPPDMGFGGVSRERREKGDSQEENSDIERIVETTNYDYCQITPPASELLLTDNADNASPENFVKFLERSCLTAEQIAYRNRNRPCFRNIQNLCIRTRSEILKPCTTISNIHSQGIPWATKDFIYAFVRLTNCWHILKGYWENRDGSSLGKIEKELTPEFRACYVRWEKETMELASQLTRVFYNLDTNLVTPQVNILKTPSGDSVVKKNLTTDTVTTSTLPTIQMNNSVKNVRGIIHLPSAPVTETVDQANQTYSGDFCKSKEEGFDSEEERRVYMKPGSYSVPKKDGNDGGATTSPRAIEFLDTAQNINKSQTTNDKYWANVNMGSTKKSGEPKLLQDVTSESDLELNLSSHLNVHEWLLSSNFSDFGEPSPVSTNTPDMRTFFVDPSTLYQNIPQLESEIQKQNPPITVLQRTKSESKNEFVSRSYRKTPKSIIGIYEAGFEGITHAGTSILETLLKDLKKYDILEGLDASDKNFFAPLIDIDSVTDKLKNNDYIYVNEIVRDLRYLINYYNGFAEHFTNFDNKKKELVTFITEMFSLKLRDFLLEYFPGFDFVDIKGDILQEVGPLKLKVIINN
ncbi:mitoshell isoform X1 [Leptinotarsa decemlineata]|uniref:mitoshell isoform X1 n=1 Tax=Leptinotarsa decemlineata TaxID=7539 RepID=UPI003D3073FF